MRARPGSGPALKATAVEQAWRRACGTAGPATVTASAILPVELLQTRELAPLTLRAGSVAISFEEVAITGFSSIEAGGFVFLPEGGSTSGKVVATLELPALQVHAACSVTVMPLVRSALDTAFDLLSGPARFLKPRDADDPTLDQMLVSAREQRTALWQTPNGGALMNSFYQYNEVYNAFYADPNSRLVKEWATDAVQSNATDTYNAVNGAGNVNADTYNSTSFQQSLYLHTALVAASKLAPSDQYPEAPETYTGAAVAVLSFTSSVNSTNNTSAVTTPMTSANVYDTVSTSPPFDPTAVTSISLTAEQRRDMRRFRHSMDLYNAAWAEAAAEAEPLKLGTGSCSGRLGPVTLSVHAEVAAGQQGMTLRVTSLRAQMAAPQLHFAAAELLASRYGGIAKQLAAKFSSASFLGVLVQAKVQAALEGVALRGWLEQAFRHSAAAR